MHTENNKHIVQKQPQNILLIFLMISKFEFEVSLLQCTLKLTKAEWLILMDPEAHGIVDRKLIKAENCWLLWQ